jgi:predicted GIY-YIG superfamily endonuclease
MKTWYVYELINLMGTVEYVGETIRPAARFANHIRHKNCKGNSIGLFYGRQDLHMHIVKEFNNHKDAFDYQCKLQLDYNLPTDIQKLYRKESDVTKLKKSKSKLGKSRPQWVKDKIKATMLKNKSTI